MSVEIKADIRHWLRELDKKYFFVMLGFAVMVYFPLISLKLTNTVDGLWTTAEYMAGASAARTHQCGGMLGAGFSWSHQASYALQTGMDENILH